MVLLTAGYPALDEPLPYGVGEAQKFVVSGMGVTILGKDVFEVAEKSSPDIPR
jgi:hypothetical protein